MEVVFSITIGGFKQIILKKDKEITNADGNKQVNKRFNVHTVQSPIQDSVENKETHEETQGQANHKSRKASGPCFAAPDPSTGQKLLQKKFSPYLYGNPLRTNLLMNVLQISDVKVTASIQPVAKLNLEI